MVSWEKKYLEALIERLQPKGDVLVVGYGSGEACSIIQGLNPKKLTIIERDPEIANKTLHWAKKFPHTSVLQGSWEKTLPTLGRFDAIFFQEFNPDISNKTQNVAGLAVQKGKELVAKIKKTYPQINTIQYSDADVEQLFRSVGTFDPDQMAKFLHELHKNGQITEHQHRTFVAKYKLPKHIAQPTAPELPRNPVIDFLKICLTNHMHKGSRFSCFSPSPRSHYENPEFFDLVITNPDYDYEETFMSIPEAGDLLVMMLKKCS